MRYGTAAIIVGLALAATASSASAFERDSVVWRKCATCHRPDATGRIARIEEIRTTPEEWTVIVDRMRRLHKMTLREGEMDALLKELCATQILTPEEQARVAYLSLWHNAQVVETPADKEEEKLYATCVRCHTAGKILSYRMTPENWARMRDFHLWAAPTVVYQMREMRWVDEADSALRAWSARLPYGRAWTPPTAKLAGAWAVFGYEPGRGAYRGEARIAEIGNGEYTLQGSIGHADGARATFTGEGTLYGGVALRTRTTHDGVKGNGAYILSGDELTGESHLPAPDFRTSRATWIRDDGTPKVARIVPGFLLKGEKTAVTIEGLNLPEVSAGDIAFAGGKAKVLAAKRVGSDAIALDVISAEDTLREAKLTVKGLDAGTVRLAPRIDSIAIVPETGRARVSSGSYYPAEGVQFEAIAYARTGAKTANRVALGPVPATFRLAAEKKRPNDDDLKSVGSIAPNGSYVPVADYGPNPARDYHAQDGGIVKVLARYQRGGRRYAAEAALLVTVPDFIRRLR